MIKPRIKILDGFRALAIIAVIFYHYFSRYSPPYKSVGYPYNDKYNYFSQLYLGVEFFFMISGFVIFYTISTTRSFTVFWRKRMVRLLPSMVIASLITWIIMLCCDNGLLFPDAHFFKNVISGSTFINPDLINAATGNKHNFAYLNGSYWSLWPEIQFYLLVSALYFANKERFLRNFLIMSTVLIIFSWIIHNISGSNIFHISLSATTLNNLIFWMDGFNITRFIPFFTIGLLFYIIFQRKHNRQKVKAWEWLALTFFMVFAIYDGYKWQVRTAYVLMSLLFFAFIYYPRVLKIFENKWISLIGVSSYFLYLIHESIGLLLINRIGLSLHPVEFLGPLAIILAMIFFSVGYTRKIESRIIKWMKLPPKANPADRSLSGKESKTGITHEVSSQPHP